MQSESYEQGLRGEPHTNGSYLDYQRGRDERGARGDLAGGLLLGAVFLTLLFLVLALALLALVLSLPVAICYRLLGRSAAFRAWRGFGSAFRSAIAASTSFAFVLAAALVAGNMAADFARSGSFWSGISTLSRGLTTQIHTAATSGKPVDFTRIGQFFLQSETLVQIVAVASFGVLPFLATFLALSLSVRNASFGKGRVFLLSLATYLALTALTLMLLRVPAWTKHTGWTLDAAVSCYRLPPPTDSGTPSRQCWKHLIPESILSATRRLGMKPAAAVLLPDHILVERLALRAFSAPSFNTHDLAAVRIGALKSLVSVFERALQDGVFRNSVQRPQVEAAIQRYRARVEEIYVNVANPNVGHWVTGKCRTLECFDQWFRILISGYENTAKVQRELYPQLFECEWANYFVESIQRRNLATKAQRYEPPDAPASVANPGVTCRVAQ